MTFLPGVGSHFTKNIFAGNDMECLHLDRKLILKNTASTLGQFTINIFILEITWDVDTSRKGVNSQKGLIRNCMKISNVHRKILMIFVGNCMKY